MTEIEDTPQTHIVLFMALVTLSASTHDRSASRK